MKVASSMVEIISSELESTSIDDAENIGEWGERGEMIEFVREILEDELHNISDDSSGESESLLSKLVVTSSFHFCASAI